MVIICVCICTNDLEVVLYAFLFWVIDMGVMLYALLLGIIDLGTFVCIFTWDY